MVWQRHGQKSDIYCTDNLLYIPNTIALQMTGKSLTALQNAVSINPNIFFSHAQTRAPHRLSALSLSRRHVLLPPRWLRYILFHFLGIYFSRQL